MLAGIVAGGDGNWNCACSETALTPAQVEHMCKPQIKTPIAQQKVLLPAIKKKGKGKCSGNFWLSTESVSQH